MRNLLARSASFLHRVTSPGLVLLTLGAVAGLAGLPSPARAVDVRYGLDLLSAYDWRGITLTDGPVLQPSLALEHASGVTVELWGNVDLDDANDTGGEVNEARLAVGWKHAFGRFEAGAGIVEYLFPNTAFPGTREVVAHVAYVGAVTPRLDVAYDVDEIEGTYARLSATWEKPLGASWRFAAEAGVACADSGWAIGGQAGLHDGSLALRLARTFGALELGLTAGWNDSLDEAVLPETQTPFEAGFTLRAKL